MGLAAVNYWAILISAVAAWILGAVWYMALAKPWMAAQGWRTEADLLGPSGKTSPLPFLISFIAELVMAWMLAIIIWHTGGGQFSMRNGLIAGFLVWLGFVLTTIAVNYGFAKKPTTLTVIDAGHWLAVLLVMGIILGAWGA